MADWWASLPENGAGLLPTQFQVSPPAVPRMAPGGVESSTQLVAPAPMVIALLFVLVTGGGVFVPVTGGGVLVPVTGGGVLVVVTGGGVLVTMAEAGAVPVSSQVARPL